jgi:hypothetical protein
MWWWKSIPVRAAVVVLFLGVAESAQAEAMLRLENKQKTKAPAKAKKKAFSLPAKSSRNGPELERYASYALAGKKEQPQFHPPSNKKRTVQPEIQWDDKHAGKVELKRLKGAKKPLKLASSNDVTAQPASNPLPMSASAAQISASVPAPKSIWVGFALIGALAMWRWLMGRQIHAARD